MLYNEFSEIKLNSEIRDTKFKFNVVRRVRSIETLPVKAVK